MNRLEKIKDMEYKISDIKKQLDDLYDMYLKAFSPKGYKSGTSYNDYDTIPGGNKEFHIEEYFAERKRLETLLELDEQILLSLKRDVDEKEYLELLNTNSQKVKFLRVVKGYTQAKTAKILGISIRQVQRLENSIGNKN